MAKCTAQITREHKSPDTKAACPACGPGRGGSMLTRMEHDDKRHRQRRLTPPAQHAQWPDQHNRAARGHNFYPDVEVPALGDTEGVPFAQKIIVARYFIGNSQWWIVEADPGSGEAFGFACLNGDEEMSEWGYISLPEIESLRMLGGVVIERDLSWRPRPAAEAGMPANAIR